MEEGNIEGGNWIFSEYKIFMLDSAKHKILNAHMCKNIKKFNIFSDLDKPEILFFLSNILKCQ